MLGMQSAGIYLSLFLIILEAEQRTSQADVIGKDPLAVDIRTSDHTKRLFSLTVLNDVRSGK